MDWASVFSYFHSVVERAEKIAIELEANGKHSLTQENRSTPENWCIAKKDRLN